jgi:predicted nucleic acid-binding protein
MRIAPDSRVVAWLDGQPRTSIWITSITVLEVEYGLRIVPQGKRKASLLRAFRDLLDEMSHRVIPFDGVAALEAAELMAARQKIGRPVDLRDTMIAGIALAQNAALASRNTSHFEDTRIRLINPWTAKL